MSNYSTPSLFRSLHALPRGGYRNTLPYYSDQNGWESYGYGVAFNAGALLVCGMVIAVAAVLTYISACCLPCCLCCQKWSGNNSTCAMVARCWLPCAESGACGVVRTLCVASA